MADDSIEVIDDFPFHPTDSPRGMHYYNMDILTRPQQKELNKYKLKAVRNTESYLNDNPTIRALVAIIYRVVLSAQPKRNLHLTIAEYFSKPKVEIEQDVIEYLQTRDPKLDEFTSMSKTMVGEGFVTGIGSKTDLTSIIYSEQMEKPIADKAKEVDDFEFMHGLVIESLNKQLEKGVQFDETDALQKILEYPIVDDAEKLKAAARQAGEKSSSDIDNDTIENSEQKWLVKMTNEHAARHKLLLNTISSELMDSDKSRKWLTAQMVNAERHWQLLQVALQGNISPEVQDSLRNWQLVLMERTQGMSPEMKEAQMEWLEGQMTQGGAMSNILLDILKLWQAYILMQGSVMSLAMIQTEINKLNEELVEVETLTSDNKAELRAKLQYQIVDMERVAGMTQEMQELERQGLQNQIEAFCQGQLTSRVLLLIIDLLKLEKKHGRLNEEEFEAKKKIITDQIDYGNIITDETLAAHKKWLEWQLVEEQISQHNYNVKRALINYELGLLGITSSQMLLTQMNWLQGQMLSSFITREAYNEQRNTLDNRIADQNRDTIPKIQEQLRWFERQYEFENISYDKYNYERVALKEKIAQIISESKTIDDWQNDLKLLQKEFREGRIPDIEFERKRKFIRERISKHKKTTSQVILEDMQALETLMKCGAISKEAYDEKIRALQMELDEKGSERTTSDTSHQGSVQESSAIAIADKEPSVILTLEEEVKEISPEEPIADILIKVSATNIVENQNTSTIQLYKEVEGASAVSLNVKDTPNENEALADQVNETIVETLDADMPAADTSEKDAQPVENVTIPDGEPSVPDRKSITIVTNLEPGATPSSRRVKMPTIDAGKENEALLKKSTVEIRSADRKSSIRWLAPFIDTSAELNSTNDAMAGDADGAVPEQVEKLSEMDTEPSVQETPLEEKAD